MNEPTDTGFLDDLLADKGFLRSEPFERISKIVVINRHWAAGRPEMQAEFGRFFFQLLDAKAKAHGFDNFDDYLAVHDDEEGEALWMIMAACIDDAVAQRWESAVSPEKRQEYASMAREARLSAPDGISSLQALTDSLLKPMTN